MEGLRKLGVALKGAVGRGDGSSDATSHSPAISEAVATLRVMEAASTAATEGETDERAREIMEAEAKEAMIARKLAPGYFTEDFDAIGSALEELPANPNPRFLEDRVAEKLLTLQMLNERLYAHIMANYTEFVTGIEAVSDVERDLQVAHILAKNSRRSLAMCAEEVKRNSRIAANAGRKQRLLGILEVLLQLQAIASSVDEYRKALAEGRYAWTVANTLACCEAVSQLDPEMHCTHDLRLTVMRILDDALACTDDSLQALCSNFDSNACHKVFDVYVALGDTTGLADKLQACFAQAVLSTSHGIIRAYAFSSERGAMEAEGAGASGTKGGQGQGTAFRNKPYNELCKGLSVEQFRPCLLKTFEVLSGVMMSHHEMSAWHAEEAERRRGNAGGGGGDGVGPGPAAGDAAAGNSEGAEVADVMCAALSEGKKLLWEHIEGRVASLLSAPSAGEGEHFLQMLEWTHCFISCGDSFCETQVANLRSHVSRQSARFFEAFHRQNMEALKAILDKELWQSLPIGADSVAPLMDAMGADLGVATLKADRLPFGVFVAQQGKLFAEGTDPVAHFRELCRDRTQESGGNGATPIPTPSSAASGGSAPAAGADLGDGDALFTSSSLKVLKCMEKYVYLMKVIGKSSTKVVEGFCQLFEVYFWCVFQTFGNKALLQDKRFGGRNGFDAGGGGSSLTPRLRTTLERISRSQAYVMGHIEDTPAVAGMAGGGGSAGGSGMGSGAPSNGQRGAEGMLSSGNMYGLREGSVAMSSLRHIASESLSIRTKLQELAPEVFSAQIDSFFQRTVMAVGDLSEHICHRVASLLLSLAWVPEQIEKCKWDIKDVGMQHSRWVDLAVRQFHQFSVKLDAIGIRGQEAKDFWRFGVSAANESMLEGFSRVKKCSIEGRAAMSLDLQMFASGLKKLAPQGFQVDLRLVDGYVKAFYVPESDLLHWAMTHREYKPSHVSRLVTCIFEANKPSAVLNPLETNKRKKALKELLEEIQVSIG